MFKLNLTGKYSKNQKSIPKIKSDYVTTAEEFLKDHNHIDHLLSTSPAVIYSRKPNQKFEFTFISDNIRMLLDFNPVAFCKDYNFWINHIHPDDQSHAQKQIELVVWDYYNAFEYRIQNKNGEYRWIHDRTRIICNESGEPVEIVGSWIDVTARKEIEKNLQRSNQFLDSIIENIPDMIFLKDAKDLRFIRFNKAGEDLLGFARKDLLGKNDYDFFPKDEADFFTQKDRDVLNKKQLHDIAEEPIHTKEKGTRFLHTKKIPILDENDEPHYLLGISEDITEKKKNKEHELQIQAQLLRREKMASIGLLAAGIAHELNNPLNGILGLIRMHQKKIESLCDDSHHVHELIEAANHMSRVLDSLNSYAKTSPQKTNNININQLIKNTLNLCHHQIESNNIRITKSYGPNLPLMSGNKSDLQQVILGLLFNAKEAMPDGGELRLRTSYSRMRKRIIIEVADTGTGMDKKDLKKIFDPFFTTKQVGEGTGLGLYLIHSIVESHGGIIHVESKLTEGTQFHIELPIKKVSTK